FDRQSYGLDLVTDANFWRGFALIVDDDVTVRRSSIARVQRILDDPPQLGKLVLRKWLSKSFPERGQPRHVRIQKGRDAGQCERALHRGTPVDDAHCRSAKQGGIRFATLLIDMRFLLHTYRSSEQPFLSRTSSAERSHDRVRVDIKEVLKTKDC